MLDGVKGQWGGHLLRVDAYRHTIRFQSRYEPPQGARISIDERLDPRPLSSPVKGVEVGDRYTSQHDFQNSYSCRIECERAHSARSLRRHDRAINVHNPGS